MCVEVGRVGDIIAGVLQPAHEVQLPLQELARTGPLVGEKLVIVGPLADTVKLLALVAVPPDVVTLSGPVVAPAGTVA